MLAKIRTFGRFLRDREGSMAVEFVVLVPLLLAALVFSFEFARALWAYDVMSRDVRGGIRYLSRASNSISPPSCPSSAENLTKTGLTNGTDANAHFPWQGVTATFTCNTTAFNTGFNQTVSLVSMRAEVPVTLSFMSFLNSVMQLSGAGALSTTFTLRVEDQVRLVGN